MKPADLVQSAAENLTEEKMTFGSERIGKSDVSVRSVPSLIRL